MIRRGMVIGVISFLFVVTAIMIYEPIHYGRAAFTECIKALDIWSGFFGIIIGYLCGTRQINDEQDSITFTKIQQIVAWGIFSILAVISLVAILYPFYYGKFADDEINLVINIWSALCGGVIGYFFRNQNQGTARAAKTLKVTQDLAEEDIPLEGDD